MEEMDSTEWQRTSYIWQENLHCSLELSLCSPRAWSGTSHYGQGACNTPSQKTLTQLCRQVLLC